MKIDRLIGILAMLLQRERVTTAELAQRFEVSRRTISRDVETLCRAGIPLATRPGARGGVHVMPGYKLPQTLLTKAELQDILAGLRSLDSVNGTDHYKRLMEKLSAGSSDLLAGGQSVLIDLSAWQKGDLAQKIALIRGAVAAGREVRFTYCAHSGESVRTVAPYYLIFRWSSWYLWGFCRAREDFRLFKLARMTDLADTGEPFERIAAPLPDLSNERVFPANIQVEALFAPESKWRLVEEYGPTCYETRPDGQLLFRMDFTDKENLLSWIASFRDQAEIVAPAWLRDELRAELRRALARYGQGA